MDSGYLNQKVKPYVKFSITFPILFAICTFVYYTIIYFAAPISDFNLRLKIIIIASIVAGVVSVASAVILFIQNRKKYHIVKDICNVTFFREVIVDSFFPVLCLTAALGYSFGSLISSVIYHIEEGKGHDTPFVIVIPAIIIFIATLAGTSPCFSSKLKINNAIKDIEDKEIEERKAKIKEIINN